jgi:hypothetical protein
MAQQVLLALAVAVDTAQLELTEVELHLAQVATVYHLHSVMEVRVSDTQVAVAELAELLGQTELVAVERQILAVGVETLLVVQA